MTRRHGLRSPGHASGCLAAVVLITVTGCSSGSASYDGPASWPAQPKSKDFSVAEPDSSSKRAAAPDSSTWDLKLSEPGDPNVASSSWPDARTALSDQQLKKAFPEATAIDAPSCTKLTLPGGSSTARDSRCTWSIALSTTDSRASTVTLSLLGIGADAPMTGRWIDAERQQISGRIGSDTFFTPGTFGAKGSYFLSNMHSSMLLSDGTIAAWVDLDFSGFYQAFGDNSAQTNTGLRNQVFPVLVQNLVARLPRSAEGTPMSPSPTTS
ncbi:MAG: hypothetical protein ABI360_04855 [Allobranchiibius sp.]